MTDIGKDGRLYPTGQSPVKIAPADLDASVVGKHQDDVLHGSRLARTLKAQGVDPDEGRPLPGGKRPEPISDSRLALIMQGKRAMRRFEWPGSDVEAGVVVLTAEEIQESAIAASERLLPVKETMDSITFMEQLQHENSVQILWRAIVDVETGRPFALNPDELRRNLPTDVLSYLVGIYNDWQAQLSPLCHPSIGEAEADRVIQALKKNASPTLLDGFDAASLRLLLKRSACPATD